jgi:DNA-binding transcriptional MerR regulator
MSERIEIPNKSFFKLNEVSSITGVKPYVLRFWETEFDYIINPANSESGQKLYEQKDIEAFLLIKKVLFEDKLPIHEAKVLLRNQSEEIQVANPAAKVVRQSLTERDLNALLVAKEEVKQMLSVIDQLKVKYKI